MNAAAKALAPGTELLREPILAFESWLIGWAEETGMTLTLKRGFLHLCRAEKVYKLLKIPIRNRKGQEIAFCVQFIDHTGEHQQLEHMEEMAKIDALTGFFNRMEYDSLIVQQTEFSSPMGVMMIDVNGLKAINDRYGHRAGDNLIRKVASVIRKTMPQSTSLYRVGGDEFVAVLPGADRDQMKALVLRLLEATQKRDNGEPISLAVGCADRSAGSASIAQLVNRADNRMYKMKREYYADERNNRRKIDD